MRIFIVNSGSSSIKFSVFEIDGLSERLSATGSVNGIGAGEGGFFARISGGEAVNEKGLFADHRSALRRVFDWIVDGPGKTGLDAVGHRVVHGGALHKTSEAVTGGLIEGLKRLIPLAPNHLPHEIMAIEAVEAVFSGVPQVACFDTAFHSAMPSIAKTYALPKHLRDEGVSRYGFHGLSYEYIIDELKGMGCAKGANGRLIIAHLGHGSSMAAINGGRCVDTTMGFTPCGGLVMSTRTGDIDPGVIIYLMAEKGMSVNEVSELVYKRSGLLALSGLSSDMKVLLSKAETVAGAKEAIDVYCYSARRHIGALSAALGGLDALVFTGGIGENAPVIRSEICKGLEFAGVEIDDGANQGNMPVISKTGGKAVVRVIRTDEERMVARHTCRTIAGE